MSLSPMQHPRGTPSATIHALAPLASGLALVLLGYLAVELLDLGIDAAWGVTFAGMLLTIIVYSRRAAADAPVRQPHSVADTAKAAEVAVGLRVSSGEDQTQDRGAGSPSPERVIVLYGSTLSGKSKIAQYAAQKSGWINVSCGTFVREEAARRGEDISTKPLADAFGMKLYEESGPQKFVDRVLEHVDIPPEFDTLVIDDVYHRDVGDAFRERWPALRYVEVELNERVRQQKLGAERVPLDESVNELRGREPHFSLPGLKGGEEDLARARDELFAYASKL